MNDLDTVVDETGTVHRLAPEPLGRGGQGGVFRTRSPDVAVKLITVGGAPARKTGATASVRLQSLLAADAFEVARGDDVVRALRERLDDVMLLPLDELQVARPIALLRGQAGYAMRLLTDMEPIGRLLAPPGTDDLAAFYLQSGGLRRRLAVLARTARLIARLHAVPAVYGDISPNNVFISSDPQFREVWLIDPDNLHLEGDRGPTVYTPGYGAPEVLQHRARPSTLSDAWSFAVLAFQVLCQAHPFIGQQVEDGGWEASVDLEAQAFAGELPWVHDAEDDTNYGELGVFPRDLVLSKRVFELFERALGDGRRDPTRRPGLATWAEVLQQAADVTVTCPDCTSTFFFNARTCPWCTSTASPPMLYVQVRRWHPDVDEDLAPSGSNVGILVLDGDAPAHELSSRLLRPSLAREPEVAWLGVERVARGLRLVPQQGGPFLVVDAGGRVTDLHGPTTFDLPREGRELHVHCGPMGENHRVASFRYLPGRTR